MAKIGRGASAQEVIPKSVCSAHERKNVYRIKLSQKYCVNVLTYNHELQVEVDKAMVRIERAMQDAASRKSEVERLSHQLDTEQKDIAVRKARSRFLYDQWMQAGNTSL